MVVAVTNDCTQQVVEAKIAHMESAAVEMIASNSAAFEERIVNRGSAAAAAAVEKLADN